MLPDWPHDNNSCCFIMSQLAQWRPPRRYTEILNSDLPSGKSTVTAKNQNLSNSAVEAELLINDSVYHFGIECR